MDCHHDRTGIWHWALSTSSDWYNMHGTSGDLHVHSFPNFISGLSFQRFWWLSSYFVLNLGCFSWDHILFRIFLCDSEEVSQPFWFFLYSSCSCSRNILHTLIQSWDALLRRTQRCFTTPNTNWIVIHFMLCGNNLIYQYPNPTLTSYHL